MKNKGCAYEVKGGGISNYYTSSAVAGFADFVRFLHENRASESGAPRPIRLRIPQTERLSETEWHNIADNKGAGYSCFIVVNIPENQVWINEDTGAGMALYCFPFTAVMEVSASGTDDPWGALLTAYPMAKLSD